jgi:vacuolar-type H+-ATPase subunit I/STV1
VIDIEGHIELPFDLRYPSARIRHQVLVARNNLELAKIESERTLDEYYGSLRQQIQTRLDELQDELATMRREVASAQAIAEEEERLRQERVAGRAAAERERKRLEAERAAEVRRLRQEQERLEAVRRKEEEATRQSLRGLDLRRCGNPVVDSGHLRNSIAMTWERTTTYASLSIRMEGDRCDEGMSVLSASGQMWTGMHGQNSRHNRHGFSTMSRIMGYPQ